MHMADIRMALWLRVAVGQESLDLCSGLSAETTLVAGTEEHAAVKAPNRRFSWGTGGKEKEPREGGCHSVKEGWLKSSQEEGRDDSRSRYPSNATENCTREGGTKQFI